MIDLTATLRGLDIGSGTSYCWRNIPSGLLDTATVRALDLDRPNRDGVIAGGDYLGSRTIAFEVIMDEGADNESLAAALAAAFAPSRDDVALDVRLTGDPSEYRLYGRPRGVTFSTTRNRWTAGILDALCSFTATDPVRYALTESSLVLSLASSGDGLVYPVEYPVVYGGSSSGQGDAANAGSAEVDWMATLTGPVTNPRIEHVSSGKFVRVAQTLTAGQTVVLDSARGAILLGGTTPRPSWVGSGSSWFRLGAGSNTLRFTADSGSGDCTVTWRSGWS